MKIISKWLFITNVIIYPSLLSCNSSAKKATTDSLKTYSVLKLSNRSTIILSDYPASIQGIQNIEIRPKIDGYIESIFVDEGATVKKGQLLFKINAPQYLQDVNTARANVKIAIADVNAAQMQVDKVRPIVDQDIVSPFQLKAAVYTLESKKAVLAQARAALKNAETNLSYTRVYSPANGVIGILPYKMGSLISSTTTNPLTTVSDISKIYAYFSINEKKGLDFFTTAKGKTMQDKLATLPPVSLVLANGAILPEKGKIETASGLINAQTGALNMRATFPNSSGLVKSGSSAIVRLPQSLPRALLVPQKSTYQIQGKLFVYVMDKSQVIQSVPVTTASQTGNSYVIQTGLKAGDNIVVDGVSSLRENLKIKPKFVSSEAAYNSL